MLHEVTDRHVLLVHGFTGAGPWHWQTWLAGELVGREISVDLPEFPDPDHPVLDRWLPVLRSHLAAAPPGKEVVVLAHSCGTTLWLHHAAQADSRRYRVDRVLLVAPPARVWTHPDVHGFHWHPWTPRGYGGRRGRPGSSPVPTTPTVPWPRHEPSPRHSGSTWTWCRVVST